MSAAPPSPEDLYRLSGVRQRPVRWRERSRLVRMLRLWRTRDPRTFREKVRYKMLRDHRQLVVTFADKAAVRAHVAAAVGERYLPRVHAVVDDPVELATRELPEEFAMKPTHGSGAAVIVSRHGDANARLPEARAAWVYRHVRREHADRDRLDTFFVFHGRCVYVQVDGGRFGRRTQDFFTRDWERVPMSGGPPRADPEPARPASLAEMIAVAERLGDGTDFVRVDLYDLDGRVVFGELTSFPAGGDSPFFPERFDEEFGRHWTVPRRYR